MSLFGTIRRNHLNGSSSFRKQEANQNSPYLQPAKRGWQQTHGEGHFKSMSDCPELVALHRSHLSYIDLIYLLKWKNQAYKGHLYTYLSFVVCPLVYAVTWDRRHQWNECSSSHISLCFMSEVIETCLQIR